MEVCSTPQAGFCLWTGGYGQSHTNANTTTKKPAEAQFYKGLWAEPNRGKSFQILSLPRYTANKFTSWKKLSLSGQWQCTSITAAEAGRTLRVQGQHGLHSEYSQSYKERSAHSSIYSPYLSKQIIIGLWTDVTHLTSGCHCYACLSLLSQSSFLYHLQGRVKVCLSFS